ncbi:Heat shock cognate 71 kDa protein [Pseudolycoriella hygida]|uniref:Heat shock cognate 71 kDa protein n=1 Tax=Pseudolycoriella hygida TaxID=35572 RepID=A0A9Q0N217_9DIPT|nr:Heat shock cognate 71 kDa protein [Pseudolycoriella hygida]
MALIDENNAAIILQKIGTDDWENETIVQLLVREATEHLIAAPDAITLNELKAKAKNTFDMTLKKFFDYRDTMAPQNWEKYRIVLITELKNSVRSFCLEFSRKCSNYLSEAVLSFGAEVETKVNSKCLPLEYLKRILSDIKVKIIAQYGGAAFLDSEQLNQHIDGEVQFFISENNRRLEEIYQKYNSILDDLLEVYDYVVELRLPDNELECASQQKLESTFNFCRNEVLKKMNKKMKFDVPEMKTIFENQILNVVQERFSQKIATAQLRRETKFREAAAIVNSSVKDFTKYMADVFEKTANNSDIRSKSEAKMNELILSISNEIYHTLPDRTDAKEMLGAAKQKMENVCQEMQVKRIAEIQNFQLHWETELRSVCEKFRERINGICQSYGMLEVEDLHVKLDATIEDIIGSINCFIGSNEMMEKFKKDAMKEMKNLSLPILESHSKILENNVQQQKDAMSECLATLETEIFGLLKGDVSEDIYVKTQKLEESALQQFSNQIKSNSPISVAATERLFNDYQNATSKILKEFQGKLEERKLKSDAEVSQLLTSVVEDYKQMLDAFAIVSNYSKEKVAQIHEILEMRAKSNLLKCLRFDKYSCDATEQQHNLKKLIEKCYMDATVSYDVQLSEWYEKLVLCDRKTILHYKQCFNSELGSASSEKDIRQLHQVFKGEAIALWEEEVPINLFGAAALPERRKLSKCLDIELDECILPKWREINLDIDRGTRNTIEMLVKNYEEQMKNYLEQFHFVSDEMIDSVSRENTEHAMKKLKHVNKPPNIDNKIYDDILSSRLNSTSECLFDQNKQKRESVLSDLLMRVSKLKDVLRRELFELKVLPEEAQLFESNVEEARKLVEKYHCHDTVTQELILLVERELSKAISDLISEWDSVQPDSNELKLAINRAAIEYNQEMENRTSKVGVVFRNKDMKEHHQLSLKVVYEKFEKEVRQTSATKDQFFEAIGEMLKRFQDENDLKAAENGEAAVGIDLGTTFSCVAIYKGGKIEMIPDREDHSYTVPSYVYYESDTKAVVGHSAKDQSILYPDATIFDSKRLIGRKFDDPETQRDITQWPFKVVRDMERTKQEPKIEVHGKTFHPEEISAEILKHLKKNAELYLDRKVNDVVITVPAHFNDAQKRATKNAAVLAGINVLEIINEPTSAAIAYSLNYTDGNPRKILIFDLGGGTFDTSVLTTENCNIIVKAVGGDNHLGGEDFDSNMVDFCIEKFRQETGLTIPTNVSDSLAGGKIGAKREAMPRKVLESLRRLRQKCENCKINLSKTDKVRVVVDCIYNEKDLDVEITVDDFNRMNRELFEKCIAIVRDTVADSKLHKTEITDVVLVGGSSRIPEVQRLLSEFFDGRSLIMTVNPDEVVAQGAAYRAAMLSGSKSRKLDEVKLIDVNPLSLGIEVIGGNTEIILEKNTQLPAERTKFFVTTEDYQTEVLVTVYEGEAREITENNLLGEFLLTNIPAKKKREEPIKVTISCDEEGLIHVTAKILSNKRSQDIKIRPNRGGLTEEDIQKVLSR